MRTLLSSPRGCVFFYDSDPPPKEKQHKAPNKGAPKNDAPTTIWLWESGLLGCFCGSKRVPIKVGVWMIPFGITKRRMFHVTMEPPEGRLKDNGLPRSSPPPVRWRVSDLHEVCAALGELC